VAKQRYTDEEKQKNLTAKLKAKGGTYRSYMSLLGESLANRIDLLAQLLNEAHYPTTGRYKESLLADLIAGFVPGRYSVGTGFVLFPVEGYEVDGSGDDAEAILLVKEHIPSRQMDIIVYDSCSYPVIYRDRDVVVVRPESVRCVIEVKGSLDHVETDDIVDKCIDFADKWRACVECYRSCGVKLRHMPTLLAMCWLAKSDGEGRPLTDGARLRERIVTRYRESGVPDRIDWAFPLLSAVAIYRQHIVAADHDLADGAIDNVDIGYETLPGVCRVVGHDKDRTVAFLLERIQLSLETRLATKAFSAPMADEGEAEIREDDKIGFTSLAHVPVARLQTPKEE
jgi:hypothetical protein